MMLYARQVARAAIAQGRAFGSVKSSTTTANTTETLIIHAAGLDRLGIVSDVTGVVIDAGGNVGTSVAGRLGPSYFSLMMLVEVPVQHSQSMQAKIRELPDLESAVFSVNPVETKTTTLSPPQVGYSGDFSLSGADHPGIVHTITSALASHGLSIDRLVTDQEIAPHGGTMLFKMHGTAVRLGPLPKSFDIQTIKQELVALGDSLNCDVKMDDTVDESYQGSFYAG